MAVAGFSKKDIEIVQQEQSLTIKGTKASSKDTTYVHKGIGARDFKQEFALAEYVDVDSADITDGILTITLRRELPEEKKPRTIKVN
jgi:molecular chaperone IbpA